MTQKTKKQPFKMSLKTLGVIFGVLIGFSGSVLFGLIVAGVFFYFDFKQNRIK
jgi:hypothetical protein